MVGGHQLGERLAAERRHGHESLLELGHLILIRGYCLHQLHVPRSQITNGILELLDFLLLHLNLGFQ